MSTHMFLSRCVLLWDDVIILLQHAVQGGHNRRLLLRNTSTATRAGQGQITLSLKIG